MEENKDLCRWLSLVLGLAMACTWAAQQMRFAAVCDQVREDTLRLHIVAASNTVADQSLKLKVRDAILVETARICHTADTQQEARNRVAVGLPQLARTAAGVLARAGHPLPVKAEMEHQYFTTTHYTSRTLPAGSYDALRITLGEGEGHNWWCCLYPTLCLSAAGAQYQDDAENAVVTAGGFEIRFALVEWWQRRHAGTQK